MRSSVPGYLIFVGMTCATRSQHGIEKLVRQPTNYSAWEGGKHNPWWNDMRMLLLKGYNLQLSALRTFCAVERVKMSSCTSEDFMNDSVSSRKDISFSRREWLMVIAILVVIEAWVLNASYAFHSEQAVINYVSFAATIASLLLAVIAIIYGYFQADGQQQAAAAINIQIDSMRTVQRELNESSAGFASQLDGMSLTATELRKLSDSLDGTHKTLGQIEGGISLMRADQSVIKEAVAQSYKAKLSTKINNTIAPNDEAHNQSATISLFQRTSFDLDCLGFALHKLVEKSDGIAVSWSEFVDIHYVKALADAEVPFESLRNSTNALQAMMIARGFGIVNLGTSDEPTLTIAKDVFPQLKLAAESAQISIHTKAKTERISATFK